LREPSKRVFDVDQSTVEVPWMADHASELRRLSRGCRGLADQISSRETRQLVARAALALALIAEQSERRQEGIVAELVSTAELLLRIGRSCGDEVVSKSTRDAALAVAGIALEFGADPEEMAGYLSDSSD
jgi:hypothetical protein